MRAAMHRLAPGVYRSGSAFAISRSSSVVFALFLLHSPAAASSAIKFGYGYVPPISQRGADGKATGFAVDVLNEAARRESAATSWIPVGGSAESESDLRSGRIDLIPAGVVTADRQHRFYVSQPWWSTELTLLMRAGNASTKRLGVAPISWTLAAKAYPNSTVIPFHSTQQAVESVCQGSIDANILTHGELHDLFINRPDQCRGVRLDSNDAAFELELSIISRRSDEPLARRLRARIDEMALDGTLLRLAAKHPPVFTTGVLQLEKRVREHSRTRTWTLSAFLILAFATWILVNSHSQRNRAEALAGRGLMPARSRRFLFAVLVMSVAVGLRYVLAPVLGFRVPFVLQSFGVAVAAQYGGILPGLLATAISVLLSGFVFPSPSIMGLLPEQMADAIGLGLFVVLGISLSFLGERFITARRQSLLIAGKEAELREQKTQLEALIESVAIPIFVTDANGTVLRANDAFRKLFSLNVRIEDYVPKEELRTLNGDLVPAEMWPIRRLLRGDVLRNVELRLEREDRNFMFVSYSGNSVRDEHGRVKYAILTLQDITERKRAEQELATGKAQLEAMIDSMAEPMIVANSEREVVLTNDAFRRTFTAGGEVPRTADDLERHFELRGPDGRMLPVRDRPLNRALRGETVQDVELECRQVDGTVCVLNCSGGPVRGEGGRVVRAVVTLQDITKRKRAEQVLREREEQLRQRAEELETVMEVAPVAIWVSHDPECREITGNKMANALYEAEAGENVSANTVGFIRRFFINGQPVEADELPMQRAVALNTEIRGAELEVLLPSGRTIAMLGHASPLRDAHDNVRGVVGAFLDITELRRNAAELERVNRIVRLAHSAGNAGAWRWDLGSGELFWTEEYYRLLGVNPGTKPTRELFFSLVHPEDRLQVQSALQDAVRERRKDFRSDFRIIKPDGIHWIERRVTLIFDENGEPAEVVGISTDVTERKRLEEALRRSNEDLQRFAYVSSHDLQEPLRNVSAMTALLLKVNRGRLAPESQRFADYIVEGVQRMNQLIDSLLEYSRVANDREGLRHIEMAEVLSTAIAHLQQSIVESGAEIITEDALPTVNGNRGLLVRVFQNLVSNAIKYRKGTERPRIRVAVQESDERWLFSVQDNGIGFDMKYAESIFVPFKRLHTHASEYKGTGIGLAIVKRAIDRHGGEVCVESEPNVGTKFYFTLPKHGALRL